MSQLRVDLDKESLKKSSMPFASPKVAINHEFDNTRETKGSLTQREMGITLNSQAAKVSPIREKQNSEFLRNKLGSTISKMPFAQDAGNKKKHDLNSSYKTTY